jgi:hypothetical protein
MALYDRPPHYAISHILFGFAAVWFPIIGILAVAYQLLQYVFNVRTFPVEWRIEKGNSVAHTGLKLAEMALGYTFGSIIKRINHMP